MNVFRHDSAFVAPRWQAGLHWLLMLHLLAQTALPALLPPSGAAAPPPPAPLSASAAPAPAPTPPLPNPAPLAGPAVLTGTLYLPLLLSDGSRPQAAGEPAATASRLYLPLLSKSESRGLDFTAAPLAGPAPLRVSFTPRGAGPAQSLTWDLGDGTVLTGPGPAAISHTYRYAGSYDVGPAVAKAGLVVFVQAKRVGQS